MDFVIEMFRCGEVIAVAEPFPQTNGERRLCIYPFTTIANQHWVRCDFDMSWYFGQVYGPSVTDILQSCKVLLFNWSISTSPIEGWARTCTHEFFSWKGVFGRWKVLNFGKMVIFFCKDQKETTRKHQIQKHWGWFAEFRDVIHSGCAQVSTGLVWGPNISEWLHRWKQMDGHQRST